MKFKEILEEAKPSFKNNFGKLLGIIIFNYVISLALTGLCQGIENPVLKLILLLLVSAVTVPLDYGVLVSFNKHPPA